MKILLATGVYPPDIGGPATYSRMLAKSLVGKGAVVAVIAYRSSKLQAPSSKDDRWDVVTVSRSGGPLLRWWRYAKALRKHGADVDIVYAFSSVSCGVPLVLSGLRKPKRVLRLGGDFLWERYTDSGGMKGLREWYESWSKVTGPRSKVMQWLLNTFDHIVFSTEFQQDIYEQFYTKLPAHSVIQNALPPTPYPLRPREKRKPFRVLFMGRFVGFKNLPALIEAVSSLEGVELTLVGDGPMKLSLESRILPAGRSLGEGWNLGGRDRIRFKPPAHGDNRLNVFEEHDLLVLPSLTEISPNVALEARAAGLPVLLTEENGLSEELRQGMVVRRLKTPTEIAAAIQECIEKYDQLIGTASKGTHGRSWEDVTEEHLALFRSLG